ncbi:putative heme-binding peroxidase [Candida viswanathii]|uniref:Peroxidase n=1 Tax=Candida viswanathii TaxID=5486 RepID=A0A367XY52_9ASCO|nr:putative heme-binding peroxidase [Candida viswanathii]
MIREFIDYICSLFSQPKVYLVVPVPMERVIQEIVNVFPSSFDDGSLAPIILRLAWHCCATYDVVTDTGGSNGATMRFQPELTDEGNTGLFIAMLALSQVKVKYPQVSYADLWTLAGKVAVEYMGRPRNYVEEW